MLHILEALRGGTSRHLADVVGHAAGVHHHVVVPRPALEPSGGALYDSAALDRMLAAGAVLHHVDMSRRPAAPVNLLALHRLQTVIGRVRPDVVHGHSSVGGALARIAGRRTGIPVLYTANGIAPGPAYRRAERALGPLTWRWVAVSESEAELVRRWGLAQDGQLVTIANGIDPVPPDAAGAAERLRSTLGVEPGAPVVGTVARLVPQKAPVEFVRMCAAVSASRPDAHFVLIGLGPLQNEVDRAVVAAGLRTRWHQLPHVADGADAVAGMDVFVLTSRFEGGPYTPLEAMRAGVPVVLTDVVGSRDCVEAGRSGLLCPPGDAERMAAAVVCLLGDEGLRSQMGGAGRKRVAARFDVATMGSALADLYRSAPPPR